MTKAFGIFGGIVAFILVILLLNLSGVICNEYSPERALKKYEWFKDQYTQIQNMESRIKDTEKRIENFKKLHGDNASKWSWNVQEEFGRIETTLQGYKENYSNLVSEYNSQSSKFNWKGFQGQIPQTIIEYK
ncbi:MAG TPA: hypothetical protein P5136_00925 [Methanofastidiosum sp.]|nr:hypothetical protein [Methanofastidiosum sp.]